MSFTNNGLWLVSMTSIINIFNDISHCEFYKMLAFTVFIANYFRLKFFFLICVILYNDCVLKFSFCHFRALYFPRKQKVQYQPEKPKQGVICLLDISSWAFNELNSKHKRCHSQCFMLFSNFLISVRKVYHITSEISVRVKRLVEI